MTKNLADRISESIFYAALILSALAPPALASVVITRPTPGETVGSPVAFVATATATSCSDGLASIGIYVNNVLKYKVHGSSLNTALALSPGTYKAVLVEWDKCGGSSSASRLITVTDQPENSTISPENNGVMSRPVDNDAPPSAKTLYELQASNGWVSWGQVGPRYIDCSPSPCNGIQFSYSSGVTTPSKSGNATEFTLGGSQGRTRYGDALFTNELIGKSSTQDIPDRSHILLSSLHDFIYDADFYVTDVSITHALEFDVSLWLGDTGGMTFGTECNYLGTKDWDVYDNSTKKWMDSGNPCEMVNGWNHVTLQFEREPDNSTLYKSITLNGRTYALDDSYPSRIGHPRWWSVNINYQIDGNSRQSPIITYLDNLSLTYW